MSARKPDPAVAAYDRLQAAGKVFNRAYDQLDEAEAKARAAGFNLQRAMIRIQNHECTSMAEVRCQARGMPKAEAAKAIQAMRTSLSIRQHRRREAGLAPFDAAERRGRREWRAAMKAMGQTRATTTRGVILKLKLIALELRDGHTGFGEAIIASDRGPLAHR
jgi:hypothetical protein